MLPPGAAAGSWGQLALTFLRRGAAAAGAGGTSQHTRLCLQACLEPCPSPLLQSKPAGQAATILCLSCLLLALGRQLPETLGSGCSSQLTAHSQLWEAVLAGTDGIFWLALMGARPSWYRWARHLLGLAWVSPADGNRCNRAAEQNPALAVPGEGLVLWKPSACPALSCSSCKLAQEARCCPAAAQLALLLCFLPAECKGPESQVGFSALLCPLHTDPAPGCPPHAQLLVFPGCSNSPRAGRVAWPELGTFWHFSPGRAWLC